MINFGLMETRPKQSNTARNEKQVSTIWQPAWKRLYLHVF